MKQFRQLFKLSPLRISAAFASGTLVASMNGIKIFSSPSAPSQRFIIALTRSIKGSVHRNRLRRRTKHALHTLLKVHTALPNGVTLCVIYASAELLSYQALVTFLENALWNNRQNAG